VQGDWLREWKKRQEIKKNKRLEKERAAQISASIEKREPDKPQGHEQPKEVVPKSQSTYDNKPVFDQKPVQPIGPAKPNTSHKFNQRSAEREQPKPAVQPSIENKSEEEQSWFASWKKRQEAKASPSPVTSQQVAQPPKQVSIPSQQLSRPPQLSSSSAPVVESPQPVTQTPQRSETLEKMTPSQASHTSHGNMEKSQERVVPTNKDYLKSLSTQPAPVVNPSTYKQRYENSSGEKFQKLSENSGIGGKPPPEQKEPSPIVIDKSPQKAEKPQAKPEGNSLYTLFAAKNRNLHQNRDGYSAESKLSAERSHTYCENRTDFVPKQDAPMKPVERTTIEIDQEEIVLPDEGSVQKEEKQNKESVQKEETEANDGLQEYFRRKKQAEQEKLSKIQDSDSEVRANKGKLLVNQF
jgi:hypothetical protein